MHPSAVRVSTAAGPLAQLLATHNLPAQTQMAIPKCRSPAKARRSYLTVVSLQEKASRNSEAIPHQHLPTSHLNSFQVTGISEVA